MLYTSPGGRIICHGLLNLLRYFKKLSSNLTWNSWAENKLSIWVVLFQLPTSQNGISSHRQKWQKPACVCEVPTHPETASKAVTVSEDRSPVNTIQSASTRSAQGQKRNLVPGLLWGWRKCKYMFLSLFSQRKTKHPEATCFSRSSNWKILWLF